MLRKAFLMTLKPDTWRQYAERHNPIWPELERVLKGHGVHNYSIYLDRGNNRTLYAYVEIESEEQWQKISETEVCRHWWAHMNDLMFTNEDDSPVTSVLEEVFHLD